MKHKASHTPEIIWQDNNNQTKPTRPTKSAMADEGGLKKIYKTNIVFSLVLVLCTTLFIHCGGSGDRKVVYPSEVTPEIQKEFNQIEKQYRYKNYSHAFHGYENFIKTHDYNKLTDEAYYKQGKIFFLQSRLDESSTKFKELAGKTPSPKYKAKAWHMSGYSRFKQESYDQALGDLKRVKPDKLPAKMRVQYFSIVISSSKRSEKNKSFGDYAKLKLFDTYESFAGSALRGLRGSDVTSFSQTKKLITAWIATPLLTSKITEWMKRYSASAPARAYIDFKLGKTYYEAKKYSKAKRLLARFVTRHPKNKYAPVAHKILKELGTTADDLNLKKAHYKVGILLPLAGRHETYSYSILDGVKCAAGINDVCLDDSGIRLIVKDSGYSTTSVRSAVSELARSGVAAIIGPLSGSLAIEAGIIASNYKIPIFPITQKTALMAQGDYIFQVGMQPKQQIYALVKATRSHGHRSIGVFHPNTNYGQTMAELFMEEARANGLKITALAEYNKWSKDVYAETRKLKKSIGRVGAPGSGIGFDAIFIPDSYQNINALVGALEFNGISKVSLLGTNAWNDPDLTLAIASKFPGSFFIDLYNPASSDSKVKDFTDQFISAFGRAPRVLEAYGYDIMMMIRESASDKGAKGIHSALSHGRGFRGVTGIRGFKLGEGPIIESTVLKIKSSGVR